MRTWGILLALVCAPRLVGANGCPTGQLVSADTFGHCCWPEQVYSKSRSTCVGAPRCPAGMTAQGESCTSACPPGQGVGPDTQGHCCWPQQAWSGSRNVCVGAPACPAGMVAQGDGCAVAGGPMVGTPVAPVAPVAQVAVAPGSIPPLPKPLPPLEVNRELTMHPNYTQRYAGLALTGVGFGMHALFLATCFGKVFGNGCLGDGNRAVSTPANAVILGLGVATAIIGIALASNGLKPVIPSPVEDPEPPESAWGEGALEIEGATATRKKKLTCIAEARRAGIRLRADASQRGTLYFEEHGNRLKLVAHGEQNLGRWTKEAVCRVALARLVDVDRHLLTAKQEPAGCRPLGTVSGEDRGWAFYSYQQGSTEAATAEAQFAALKLGANVLVIDQAGQGSVSGRAFACSPGP